MTKDEQAFFNKINEVLNRGNYVEIRKRKDDIILMEKRSEIVAYLPNDKLARPEIRPDPETLPCPQCKARGFDLEYEPLPTALAFGGPTETPQMKICCRACGYEMRAKFTYV